MLLGFSFRLRDHGRTSFRTGSHIQGLPCADRSRQLAVQSGSSISRYARYLLKKNTSDMPLLHIGSWQRPSLDSSLWCSQAAAARLRRCNEMKAATDAAHHSRLLLRNWSILATGDHRGLQGTRTHIPHSPSLVRHERAGAKVASQRATLPTSSTRSLLMTYTCRQPTNNFAYLALEDHA
jgi:hypothetical protein